jgi:uncharacterized protein (TIGR02246 family)
MLSVEDRLAIEELYARYCHAFDFGDGEAWAGLYTPDGSFVNEGVADFTGTENLAAFVVDRFEQVPGMRHITANIIIEEDGDGARGTAYVYVIRLTDEELRLRNTGMYRDDFVRTGAGWRFAKRTFQSWLPPALVDAPFEMGTA